MTMAKSRLNMLFRLVVGVAVILHVFGAVRMWGYTVDDAYITFRYSEHLAQGLGPSINFAGDAPVEGYTSPLWMLLLAGAYFITPDLPTAAKILGLALNLGTIGIMAAVIRGWVSGYGSLVGAAFGILWTAACYPLVASSVEGLETPLAGFLTMLTVWVLFSDFSRRGVWVAMALLQIGLYLTRPDLLLGVVGIAFLWIFGALPHDGRGWKTRVIQAALCYGCVAGVIALHMIWRHHYYGHWMPCTFYAKAGGTMEHVRFGFHRINVFFLGQTRTDLLLILQPFVLTLALAREGRKALKVYLLLVLLIAVRFLFYLYSGGEIMGFFRFLTPAIPVMGLLWSWSINHLTGVAAGLPNCPRGAFRPDLIFVVCLACGFAFLQLRRCHSPRAQDNLPLHQAVGQWLCRNARPGWTVALGDVGIVFYIAKHFRVLDILGLNDYHIAQLPGAWIPTKPSPKVDVDYVLAKRPEVIVIRRIEEKTLAAIEADIERSTRFQAGYVPVERRDWLHVYLRSDLVPERDGSGDARPPR